VFALLAQAELERRVHGKRFAIRLGIPVKKKKVKDAVVDITPNSHLSFSTQFDDIDDFDVIDEFDAVDECEVVDEFDCQPKATPVAKCTPVNPPVYNNGILYISNNSTGFQPRYALDFIENHNSSWIRKLRTLQNQKPP